MVNALAMSLFFRASRPRTGQERLRAVVEQHLDAVTRTLRHLGVRAADVDDAAQQVLLVAARRLGEVEEGAERAFLLGVARNVAMHARRSIARRRESPVPEHEEVASELSPEEALQTRQAAARLDAVLATLPDEQREVFVLFELEELTMAEIAVMLAIPAGTVASRLRRARARFSELVNELKEGGAHG